MSFLKALRSDPAFKDSTDEELLLATQRALGVSLESAADTLGLGNSKGGVTSQQISSSVDRYQAGLYGVGEAMAEGLGAEQSAEYLRRKREENESSANLASSRARRLGAVDSWEDVHGVGDFGSYAKGLAIQSLPYAAEALAGGVVARGAMSGTRAALAGAKTLEEATAAKNALNIGSQAGAVAASYPSAVGDVLGNQREQSGETRGGVAAALAVPYAALNAVGIESALARGTAFKNTVNILDRGTGLTGAAARTAATATGVALKEGASETGQEMLNQVGRMSVDANEDFLSAAAQERFKESFIGGAALGGMAGAVGGGWRRSEGGNDISQAMGAKDTTQPSVDTTQFAPATPAPVTPVAAPAAVAPVVSTPQAAPAVAGGTTDVAQAATGITQAQFAEQQRQQQEETNRLSRDKTFQTLGAQYSPENTGQLNIFGATLFDDAKINAFGNTLAAKFNALPETAHAVADAIAQANELTGGKVINVKLDAGNPVGAADKVLKALSKTADAFQIGHVQNIQQAATILNTLSRTEKGNKLDQLNAIHYALTGEDTAGFLEAQQAEATKANKGAKNAKLPVQTTAGMGTVPVEGGTTEAISGGDGGVRPAQVQPVGAASVGEGPLGLQVGQPPAGGVRTSAGNVPNVGSGEAAPQVSEALSEASQTTQPKAKLGVPVRVKAAGKQGAPSVQPTPAPAPKATQREEAKLSPAEELWNDMDATDTPYASLTPALKQAWERAVETKQATGAIQEEIADQASDNEQEGKSGRLIAGILQMVVRPYGRLDEVSAQKKREFFQAFWGGAKLDSLATIAKDMDISIDQARKWHAELPKFLDKNGAKIIAAAATVAESQGITMRELEQLLEDIETKRQAKASTTAQVAGEEETGQSTTATEEPVESDTTGEDEFGVDEMTSEGGRDEGPTPETTGEAEAASNLNIRTRKSLSIQERYNAMETNNARILKTMEAIRKAEEAISDGKSDPEQLAFLNARLEVELAYGKKLATRNKLKGEFGVEQEQSEKQARKIDLALTSMAHKKLQGKPNAVQVKGADAGDVREPAAGSEEVGKANAEPKKPTRTRKTKVEAKPVETKVEEVKTDAEKAADAWDTVTKDIPGAPLFADLAEDQRETFIEYGDENWTRADVVAELKKLNAAQPVKAATTDEERKDAESHATETGGSVVWQEGPWALIRGYSVMSGQPVYVPANGASRWRKDIEGLPETVPIPADVRAKLIAAKKEVEAADAAKHAASPFIKFEGNGMALSSGVDRRLGGVVAGWKNLLNIKANVYITTLEDARADKDKFTGPHRAIGSAGLDANEAGSMRKMGTDYYIAFTKGTSYLKMLETLAHELGHLHQDEAFRNAPDDVQLAIREEHEKFVKANKGKTAREFVTALRARTTGRSTKLPAGAQATELTEYWRSFSEWYADQVSKWATSSEKPVGVVETFFAKLGAALKKFYYSLKGKQYLPTETMKQFLDSVADRKLIIAPTNVDTGTESRAILAGVRSMNNMKGEAKDALKGQFATAKIMEAAGDSPMAIWAQTGWYKGVEGKWRYEIPDTNAKYVGNVQWGDFPEDRSMMLDDVLDHPALFDAIPSLRDIEVVRDSNMTPGEGSYSARSDVIRIGSIDPASVEGSNLTALQVLLHEVQHAVQEREGFAKGGNLEAVDPYDYVSFEKLVWQRPVSTYQRAIMLLEPFIAQHQAVRDAEIKAAEYYANMGDNPTMDQEMRHNRLDVNAFRLRDELTRAVHNAWVPLGGKRFAASVRQEMYEMIGGEAEANVVMNRQGKTAEQLAAKMPERIKPANQLLYKGPEIVARHIASLPKQLQPTTQTVVDTLMNSGKDTLINRNEDVKHLLLAAGITEDVVNGATKFMPSAQDYLNNQYERQGTRIEHEQRIQKIEEAFEKLPTELQGTGRGSVNEFIFDSTSDSAWGYVPSYNPNIKPDAVMAQRFDAMPDAAQRVIKMVFDHGYQSLRLKQKAVKAAADKEFSQREADANGDQEILNEIAAERTAWESKFDRLMNIKNDMPYAYLGRYGDYVAVAKSETFVDAEKLAVQGDLDAAKWLEQNQSDSNHYIVEFAETMAEAKNKAEQWKASGRYQQVYGAEKEVSEAFVGGSDLFMGITRLRNMITRRIKSGELTIADQETLDALHKTVSDLYLATVSEASAHRTAMQRKNISGADKDMMRNLATRGRADAHFLASLKHNDSITDAISNMRDEAKGDPTNARPYLNELLKRYANDINYKTPAPWSRMMTRLGHTWFLSFNPAFYLQQMTQTYVLSLPYMAGRLGYHRSLRSINAAYKDVVSLVKDTNVNEHLDFSKAPADVRDMLLKLVRMGKIDIGIDADAVVYANERTLTSSVMRKLNGVNNRIEAVNRATAAVAAYRGYLQRFGANNTEAATKFAAETVSNTHGSYDGFNTPRILNSNVGRVVGQFKRFQIIQLSMLGKLIKNAFSGASAEERMVARRSLAFITSHMAVLGGALGVPFVSQIANLLNNMFGDDDEPKDLEYQLRQAIGDPTLASLLTRGVPAALGLESLGKKLAMENVASILPFTDVDLTSRSGAEKMLVGLMGPSAALSLKAADALGLIGKGEYYKGLEQALPSGFANAMKGYRFATEGITLRNGDVVLSPEEVSMVDAAFQAIGLPTNTITHRQYRQNVAKEFDKFFQTKATEIKGAYVNASREGDGPAMTEARQAWQEMQDARAKNGYTRQPVSELFKAVVAARKREASTVGGVETTKANKQFVKNII